MVELFAWFALIFRPDCTQEDRVMQMGREVMRMRIRAVTVRKPRFAEGEAVFASLEAIGGGAMQRGRLGFAWFFEYGP